ncbi:GerAB/ArcD/ProY family transporter [Acutalibacter caecimuris]|uniref:GerAB/ArcD/ProY family transporter n=1 Tax=Acutalibacter caecimuris TaxID=3093657 RepID=UPI002AC9412E|nr:GerAB/ArcD/ProY family transporter [Acutalibacter sp. M00118]
MQCTKISAAQFFTAMFVSRVVVTIALNAQYTGGQHMLDNIFSYLLAMLLGAAIALPIWLATRGQVQGVPGLAMARLGWLGGLVPLCYGLYFVLVGGTSLALFQIFLMDTVNPGFSAGLVVVALLAVALYGALHGLETVARCAVCVFIVLLAGCGLVFFMASARFRWENLEPLFYDGFAQTGQGVMLFIARTSIFADMAVLLPQVRGRKKLGFLSWAAGTAAFVSVTILMIVGCLGRYAYTQNFPVYVLASLTEVRSLQRLDAVFTGVWMMGLIIKLACDLYACRVCFSALRPRGGRVPGWTVCATALLVLGVALLTAGSSGMQGFLLNTGFLFWCTVITGAALPLLVWVAGKGRKGGKTR